MESTPNRTKRRIIGSSVKFEIDEFNNWNIVNSLYPETRKNSLQTNKVLKIKFWFPLFGAVV